MYQNYSLMPISYCHINNANKLLVKPHPITHNVIIKGYMYIISQMKRIDLTVNKCRYMLHFMSLIVWDIILLYYKFTLSCFQVYAHKQDHIVSCRNHTRQRHYTEQCLYLISNFVVGVILMWKPLINQWNCREPGHPAHEKRWHTREAGTLTSH